MIGRGHDYGGISRRRRRCTGIHGHPEGLSDKEGGEGV